MRAEMSRAKAGLLADGGGGRRERTVRRRAGPGRKRGAGCGTIEVVAQAGEGVGVVGVVEGLRGGGHLGCVWCLYRS